MRTTIFRLAAIGVMLMGALVFGTAASADTGNGAVVFNAKPVCFDIGYG